MAVSQKLLTRIVDGRRSVYPRGRFPLAAIVMLAALPIVPALPVFFDSRSGLRLVMLSLTVYTVVLAAAMIAWTCELRERVVRVAAPGPLRFLASRRLRLAFWLVNAAGLLPAVAAILVRVWSLPTLDGARLLEWGPYVLAAVSAIGLARAVLVLRTPAGLRIDATGLHGVRGSDRVEIDWEDLARVEVVGASGPKLALSARDRAPMIIDAHHLGSDPAAVAAIIGRYLTSPERRADLADGVSAVRLAESVRKRD